ncbi:hypothetical protein P3G55_00220 [Leptospira sp. 96542]|nr:hypothetical protein [Leptospira sp. 96542]
MGKTTLSYRERKKQLDGKISLVLDINDQLKLETDSGKVSIESLKKDLEETYRQGKRPEIEKALNIAEGEVLFSQRKLCTPLEEIATNLYQKAMGQWILIEGEDKASNKKLEWDTKEKIQRYLSMAKSEKDHARDFYLSGNYHLSLHTYKRSIVYSLMSMRTQKTDIPEEYTVADQVWVDPIWQSANRQKPSSIREN